MDNKVYNNLYSEDYYKIKKEAETNWSKDDVDFYNSNIATSKHSKKIINNKYIVQDFPWIAVKDCYNNIIYNKDNIPVTYFDELDDGWKYTFVLDMLKEINELLISADYVDKFVVTQIKEKYGDLRFYHGGVPEEIFDKLEEIIEKYILISSETCCICGNEGKARFVFGLVDTLCDDCYDEGRYQIQKIKLNKHC